MSPRSLRGQGGDFDFSVGALSGPSFAQEVARGDPTAITIASQDGSINVADISSAAGTSLDSGGGDVQASRINGPLTITSEDGFVSVATSPPRPGRA